MAADSWQQPDSMEQKLYTMRKESNIISVTEQYVHKYLQNDTEEVSIHMLNDECLRHIFQFLPIIDRVRIEIVCKRWRDLSQDSWYMVKTLALSNSTWNLRYPHMSNIVLLKILRKCGKFLTRINLNKPIRCLDRSTLNIIGRHCPNLTNIDVTALTICTSGIHTLATNCKNITKFNLGPSTKNCDNELEYLFKLHKNLKYLAITRNNILGKCLLHLPEQTVHTIILDRCNDLEDNYFAMALKKLENLKHLAITQCTGIAKHTLEVVGQHCKNLKTLELNGNFPSAQATDMLYLYHLVNLQVLKITYNREVSDDFLICLVQHCQQLSSIDITGCCNVSDAGLTAIATLARLEKLKVSSIRKITDDGLKNVSGLKELECRCCLFSNRGMIMLIKSSPELQLLDLSGCPYIKDNILDIAKDVCSSRTNNVMLKVIVGRTAIRTKKKIDQEKLPPLLNIVNDERDLSSVNEESSEDKFDEFVEFHEFDAFDAFDEFDEFDKFDEFDAFDEFDKFDEFDAFDEFDKFDAFDAFDAFDEFDKFDEFDAFDEFDKFDEFDAFDAFDAFDEFDKFDEFDAFDAFDEFDKFDEFDACDAFDEFDKFDEFD